MVLTAQDYTGDLMALGTTLRRRTAKKRKAIRKAIKRGRRR